MRLTPQQLRKLKDAFNQAAENSPYKGLPVHRVGPYGHMTPEDLAKALENGTPAGKYFIRMIEDTITYGGIPFNSVIREFTKHKPPKP